jgi:hypothetical protein
MTPNVKEMLYAVERASVLGKLCQERDFMTGRDARCYTLAWENLKDAESVLAPEGIDNSEHLRILNHASKLARRLLQKLGWMEPQLSSFIRTYECFADVADVLQKCYNVIASQAKFRLSLAERKSLMCIQGWPWMSTTVH